MVPVKLTVINRLICCLAVAVSLVVIYSPVSRGSTPVIERTTVADIAQAVAPAVVNIEVNQPIGRSAGVPLFDMPFGGMPGFDFFYNGQRLRPSPAVIRRRHPMYRSSNLTIRGLDSLFGKTAIS